MPDQTKMNGHPAKESPAAGVGQNLTGLAHDLIALIELQCQLVAVDLRAAKRQSLIPIVMIAGAALLALGTMPVILLGIGWALVNQLGFSFGAAFASVCLSALVVAWGTGHWGWTKLKSTCHVLRRSQQELTENVQSVKRALLTQKTQAQRYRQRM